MWVISLLNLAAESRHNRHLDLLDKQLLVNYWDSIDQIQKTPAFHNVIHPAIASRGFKSPKFAGLSARKIKRGFVYALAEKAFVSKHGPLTHIGNL